MVSVILADISICQVFSIHHHVEIRSSLAESFVYYNFHWPPDMVLVISADFNFSILPLRLSNSIPALLSLFRLY